MEVSVIKDLKKFEDKEKVTLDAKKKDFLESLDQKKKDILEKNRKELQKLSSKKEKLLENAKERAAAEALSTIQSFKGKADKMKKVASKKVEPAVEKIFEEFLNQNV